MQAVTEPGSPLLPWAAKLSWHRLLHNMGSCHPGVAYGPTAGRASGPSAPYACRQLLSIPAAQLGAGSGMTYDGALTKQCSHSQDFCLLGRQTGSAQLFILPE